MEKVQKCDRLKFVSEPIELKSFLNLEAEVSPEIYELDKKDASLEHKMNEYLGDVDFNFDEIDEACSFTHLTAARLCKITIKRSLKIPAGVKLKTLELQKKAIKAEREYEPDMTYFRNLLYPLNFPFSDKGIEKVTPQTEILSPKIELPEILLTVQIYRPILKLPTSKYIHVDQEFHVLGQNVLSELQDQIGCISDYAVPGEFSEDPDMPISGICFKDMYKSNFFFINGTFYNDDRSPEHKDYSKHIIEWSKSCDRGIGPFETKSMHKVKFIDLDIRIGYPYLYFHQGNCEHFLVFCDIRLLTKDDSLFRESYPRFSKHISKHRTFCMVCQKQGAKKCIRYNVSHAYIIPIFKDTGGSMGWVVTENARLPDTPYFFCNHCFKSFNYKGNGSKIGEFKARKVLDHSVLT